MGWIYVDSRNDLNNLNDNTIIYGHNIRVGIQFGSLKNVLEKDWFNKEKNHVITFNTPKKNMKWQVFSVYMVPKTGDYLDTTFTSKEAKEKFIKLVKDRSLFDFNIKVTADHKILTLSTCNNHVNRTVLHAILIEDNNIEPDDKKEEVKQVEKQDEEKDEEVEPIVDEVVDEETLEQEIINEQQQNNE